ARWTIEQTEFEASMAALSLLILPLSDNAAKSDMVCRTVDGLGMSGRRPVAATVIRCAQMRTAFQHFARDRNVRKTRVVARGFGAAARIFRNTTRICSFG